MVWDMMLKLLSTLFLLAIFGQQVSADNIAVRIQKIIDEGRNACESDGGVFSMEPSAQAIYKFTSGATVEEVTIVNENYFNCSSTASLYGGSAGAPVHLITTNDYKYGYSRAIEIITAFNGTPLILLGLHGMSCDDAGYKPCIQAITLFEGELLIKQ